MKMMDWCSTLSKMYGSALCTIACGTTVYPQPYKPGQSPSVLKWKPPSLNTVDFKLAIVEDDRPGYAHSLALCLLSNSLPAIYRMLKEKVGQLWVGGYQVPFSQIDLKVRESEVVVLVRLECGNFSFSATRKPVTIMGV